MVQLSTILKNVGARKEVDKLTKYADFSEPIRLPHPHLAGDWRAYIREPQLSYQLNPNYGTQGPLKDLKVSATVLVYNPSDVMGTLMMYVINESYHPRQSIPHAQTANKQNEAVLETIVKKLRERQSPNFLGQQALEQLKSLANEELHEAIKRRYATGKLIKAIKRQYSTNRLIKAIREKLSSKR